MDPQIWQLLMALIASQRGGQQAEFPDAETIRALADVQRPSTATPVGAFLQFPNMIQGAMDQIGRTNLFNQAATGRAREAMAPIEQQRIASLGDLLGTMTQQRGAVDLGLLQNWQLNRYLTDPLRAEEIRGALPIELEREKTRRATSIFDKLSGVLGGALGGQRSQPIRGFMSAEGGQSAMLPGPAGAALPTAQAPMAAAPTAGPAAMAARIAPLAERLRQALASRMPARMGAWAQPMPF